MISVLPWGIEKNKKRGAKEVMRECRKETDALYLHHRFYACGQFLMMLRIGSVMPRISLSGAGNNEPAMPVV